MRPHQSGNRKNVITLSLLASLILGAIFVFAPMKSIAAARQALATRLNASPAAQKIMAITPAPVRALVRRQFEPMIVTTQATVEPISLATNGEASLNSLLVEPTAAMAVAAFTQAVNLSPVCAGSLAQGGLASFDYLLTVTNDGVADSAVQLSMTLPVGFTIIQLNVGGAGFGPLNCAGSVGTGALACTGGTLGAGATASLGISTLIPGTTPAGVYPPIADGSYASAETITQGAAGSAAVTVQRCLSLALLKGRNIVNGENDDAVAGQSDIGYGIQVTNNGPSTALPGEITITDALGTTPVFALTPNAGTGGTFNGACTTANLITVGCSNSGNIPSGGFRTITFLVPVPANGAVTPAECSTIDNRATATSTAVVNNNPQVANAPVVTVVQRGNFAINAFQSLPNLLFAGENITYSFNLDRIGANPSVIFGGTVTLGLPVLPAIPPGTISQLISSTPPAGWTCVPPNGTDAPLTTVVCSPPAAGIPAGPGSFPFSFVVKTNSLLPAATILSASATWTPPGPGICDTGIVDDPASAFDFQAINVSADLGINKTANPAAVTAGDPASILTYVLTFGNNPQNQPGSDAVNVSIVDNVPANTTVLTQPVWVQTGFPVAFPAAPINVSCLPAVVTGGQQFICTPTGNTGIDPSYIDGVLPKGVTGTITYTVTVPGNIAQGTIIGNAASIASNTAGQVQFTPDPNAGNNVSLTTSTIVNALADLGITKVTGNATPVAGGAAFTYTLTVTNNGPSSAKDVVVNDPLPPGVIFQNVSVVNAGGGNLTCSGPPVATNGTVSCTSGDYPSGASSTITIVAQVIAGVASGVRTNTATVISSTTEPAQGSPNTASVQQNITVNAPLSITKAGPATVCAGDTFTYHITVQNGGDSTALNATISDPLPANTTFLSQVGTGAFAGTCSHNGGTPGTVTCASVDIPSGLSTLDITVKLAAGAPSGPLSNTATITTAGTGTIAVGTSTTTANVFHCSDLEITKTASPSPVSAGADLVYTIAVKNIGPSDIDNIPAGEFVVNDAPFVPAGTTLKGVISAPGFSCNLGIAFPCTATAPLPAGATATISFTVTVLPSFNNGLPGGTITNTATVGIVPPSDAVDSNATNNSSTANTPVIPSADLSIDKQALTVAGGVFGASVTAGGNVSPGFGIGNVGLGEIEYTLTYRNNGTGDATNVHIRDVIPAGTLLDPIFLPVGVVVTPLAGPGLTCQLLPTLDIYQLDCTPNAPNGVLPAGANGTIQFAVRVPENILDGAVIRNQASINSEGPQATPDSSSANNTSQETQNIVRTSADLAITKTGPAAVNAGQVIQYVLTATNNGVSDAQNVVIKDTLPPGVGFQNASSSDPSFVCTFLNGVVSCQGALLMAPAINPPLIIPPRVGSNVVTITINGVVGAGVPDAAVLNNTGTVATSTQDPVPANNTSNIVTTTVTSTATVNITKIANPNPVVAGTNLTYTITVQNTGPSNANGVVVTDPLPAETSFVSATGTGAFSLPTACSFAAGTVTCVPNPPGFLLPGPISTITIVVHVNSSAVGPNIGPNTATVVWTNPAASTASSLPISVALAREADLQIDKTCASNTIAGSNFDCTIKIKNAGPSDVKGNVGVDGPGVPGSVFILDTLPAGGLYVSSQIVGAGGFTCSFAAPLVICVNAADAAGNIPVGGEATLVVKSSTPSNTPAGTNWCDTAEVGVRAVLHPDPDPVDPNLSNNVDTACALVQTSADLTVSKTSVPVVDPDGAGPLAPVALPIVGPNVPPGSVNAGGYIRYDVPFGNAGASDAINVNLSNVVPGNTAFVGAIITGGVFVPAAQPPAVPFSFAISAVDGVAPLGPNVNINCTVVGAPGSQQIFCVPQGNGALVPPYADGILPAGYSGQLTFFVKVNESVAGGTVINDPAIITSGLCPNGTGPVPPTWPPVSCPATADPNTSNNVSPTTQNVVVASSNLTVSKIVQSAVTSASNPNQTGPIGPATPPNGAISTGTAVLPGTFLTYRVTITNNGPSDVSNIRLTDLLPSGLETPPGRVLGAKYISVTQVVPSGATFTCAAPTGVNPSNNPQGNGGSLACTAPLLSSNAPNNTAAIDITVFIDPATKGSLVDTATVDATLNNFNRPISGTTVLTTPVAATSDLALTKTHTNAAGVLNGAVIAGTTFTYAITLTNNGPSAAQMASVIDTLPPFQKVTGIAIAQTPNGNGAPSFSCNAVPAVGAPGNTTSVTCAAAELPPNKNPDNTVNPSGTVVFTLTVLQDQLTPQPVPVLYTNVVTATSMSTDPIPANNTNVSHDVPIGFVADPDTLTLKKVDVPDPVIAGTLLTYTITATNNGPSAALNFTVSDTLPATLRFVSAVASPGATLTTPAVNATGAVIATWDAAGGTPGGLTAVGVVRRVTIVTRVCPDVTCNSVISNTATSSSLTPDGQVANNSDTATTTVQSQSDLSITKTDSPDPVKPSFGVTSQYLTYTIQVANAGPSNSANTVVTDVLPPGFTVFSTSSTIPGTTFTESVGGSTGDQITVTANLGVLGAANQCAAQPLPISGTIVIVVRVPIKFPNSLVTNTATIVSGNCLPDSNPANNTATAVTEVSQEPQGQSAGLAWPANSEASDDKSGSVLFFPLYTSNASVPAQQNTTISLTNTAIYDSATIHLFVVDGVTCSAQDVYICLTPNQTISFLASDFDPGVTGYIVAVAVNPNSGRPVSHNCLVGDAYVKFSSGHRAGYGAVAVSTLLNNPTGVDPLSSTAELKFDGVHYNRLPRILAMDGIPSPGEGNSTMLSLMAVGGNMSLAGARLGSLTGNLFDDRENNYSFNEPAPTCVFTRILTDSFPRTFTPFSGVVAPGRSGWMKVRAFSDIGILGVMLNYNENAAIASNAFNNGHLLHGVTLTDRSTLIIPVDIPECR